MPVRRGHTKQTPEHLFTRLIGEGITPRTIRRIRWILGPLIGVPYLIPRRDVKLTDDQYNIILRPAIVAMRNSGIEERHNTLTDEDLADIARPLIGTGP